MCWRIPFLGSPKEAKQSCGDRNQNRLLLGWESDRSEAQGTFWADECNLDSGDGYVVYTLVRICGALH